MKNKVRVENGKYKFEGEFHKVYPNQPIRDENEKLVGVTNPRAITHVHTYGGEAPFFAGLTEGKLLGTKCANNDCEEKGIIFLPFRILCPNCLSKNKIIDLTNRANKKAVIYTCSTTERTGAFNTLDTPIRFIDLEIKGVTATFLKSYLLCGEPEIGMRIKPIFRMDDPTYTIIDLAWVPADTPEEKLPKGFYFAPAKK